MLSRKRALLGWLRVAGLAGAFALTAVEARAANLGVIYWPRRPVCFHNCESYGYYPNTWRPWPAICRDASPATMTFMPTGAEESDKLMPIVPVVPASPLPLIDPGDRSPLKRDISRPGFPR